MAIPKLSTNNSTLFFREELVWLFLDFRDLGRRIVGMLGCEASWGIPRFSKLPWTLRTSLAIPKLPTNDSTLFDREELVWPFLTFRDFGGGCRRCWVAKQCHGHS